MQSAVESLLAELPEDPVFALSNHHSERFVEALATTPVEDATAVCFPIGSVDEHGTAIRDLAETPGWRVLTSFVSPPLVDAVADGVVEYVPVRTSAHAEFVRRRFGDRHVVFVGHVPPAVDGRHTYGIACPHGPQLFEFADTTVAVENEALPVVAGPSEPVADWDVHCTTDEALPTFDAGDAGTDIGAHVASLVPDGATIQLGIGSVPDAVTAALRDHSGLTVHSGVISEGVLDLADAGALDETADTPVLTSLLVGQTPAFYDRVAGHELLRLAGAPDVQRPDAGSRHDQFVAINSAIEVDLRGQVNASHIGAKQYAAPGGLPDFAEAAHNSHDGASVVAMAARAKPSAPKIVPELGDGAPVDLPRTNVDYVVTEYGVATLVDRTPRERARELIRVAHPDDRAHLAESASETYPDASFGEK